MEVLTVGEINERYHNNVKSDYLRSLVRGATNVYAELAMAAEDASGIIARQGMDVAGLHRLSAYLEAYNSCYGGTYCSRQRYDGTGYKGRDVRLEELLFGLDFYNEILDLAQKDFSFHPLFKYLWSNSAFTSNRELELTGRRKRSITLNAVEDLTSDLLESQQLLLTRFNELYGMPFFMQTAESSDEAQAYADLSLGEVVDREPPVHPELIRLDLAFRNKLAGIESLGISVGQDPRSGASRTLEFKEAARVCSHPRTKLLGGNSIEGHMLGLYEGVKKYLFHPSSSSE